MNARNKLTTIFLNCFLIAVSLFAIFPYYIMIIMGTYRTDYLFRGLALIPGDYFFENLKTVFSVPYIKFYYNSMFVSFTNTVLVLVVSVFAGYGFAKFEFKLKKIAFAIVMAALFLPSQLSIVGFITEMKNLGLLGTFLPLIVTAANPFGVFFITSFIKETVPNELLESARIDGCKEVSVVIRIVAPIIKPAIGTLGVLAFLPSWNNYLIPSIVLTKKELYTLPVAVKLFSNLYRQDYGAQCVALTLAIIPIIAMFIIFSKSLIKGITAGAVKG